MPHLLVTNDDGIDSPALPPLARALATVDRVEVVVPDRERSWISKAITRHDEIEVSSIDRDGIAMLATTGYPADCTQLGIHALFDEPPRLVISGVNVGFNFGAAYMLTSGTVGAAVEAALSGLPAVAISAGTNGDWPSWARWVLTPDATGMWERMALVATDIVSTLLEQGFPSAADVVVVNIPDTADLDTPRRVVPVARVGYGELFGATRDGVYAHEFGGEFVHFAGLDGTDVETARNGEIAIAPIQLHQPAEVSDELRRALER